MKNNKAPVIILLFLLVLLVTGLTFGFALSNSNSAEKDDSSILSSFNPEGVFAGSISQKISSKNEDGQTILEYSDGNYTYYVPEGTKDITLISLNDVKMDELEELFSSELSGNASQSNQTISRERAEEVMYEVVKRTFPEYKLDNLSVTLDDETGSYIEYFRYYIEEKSGNSRINIASVSLAFNGQVTLVSGTHNSAEMFNIKSDIDENKLLNIALSYIIKNKDDIEKAASSDGGDRIGETIVATEDMVLPDGVSVGDTFSVEKLPEYKLYVEKKDDLQKPNFTKIMYGGSLVWEVDFSIKTSWGDYDKIFNPYITVYIDAQNGKVVDSAVTDGE